MSMYQKWRKEMIEIQIPQTIIGHMTINPQSPRKIKSREIVSR
jgi:hypothetical protein